MPLVSVIIPAYNALHTIPTALASVFAQTWDDYEVIVIDDGSNDGTRDAVAPWRDAITYVRQPNGGPGRARNCGISRAKGALLAFLDADDTWLPEKLERQVEYFRLFPDTGLLHTAAFLQHSHERPPISSVECSYPPSPPRRVLCEIYETQIEINTLTVMVPRAVIDQVGGFDERREIHVEDWDLWLRIAERFAVGYLRCPLAVRIPGGGMSAAVEKNFAGQQLVLDRARPAYVAACLAQGRKPRPGRPLHRCAWELGYGHLERRDRRLARRAFRTAIAHYPTNLRTHAYHLASCLPGSIFGAVRAVRRRGRTPASASRIVPPPAAHGGRSRVRRAVFAQDTVYRRARRRLTDKAHEIDGFLGSLAGGPRRVLFEAASPVSFVMFKSIYARLSRDPRIRFYFTSTTRSWPAEAVFRAVGITDNVIAASRAAWMRFDACINTDFYDMAWLHRRTVRLQLFHGVAGKYGIDAPVHMAPDIAEFDALLFPNLDRMQRYLAAGLIDERSALLVGYPKIDCLVNGSLNREDIARGLGLRPGLPTVLYAPTWSPDSSLHLMGEAVIRTLVNTGFNVLVKLHDRSYDLTRRASGGIDWTARLAEYDGHERVRVVRDPDASPCMVVADALVTDHSSIGFEFSLLDRPLVVLDAPRLANHARINPEKIAMLRRAAEVVQSPADLEQAIVVQLTNPRLHADERRRIAEQMFYRPGTATDRAISVIYDAIQLAPPAAAVQQSVSMMAPVVAQPDRKVS